MLCFISLSNLLGFQVSDLQGCFKYQLATLRLSSVRKKMKSFNNHVCMRRTFLAEGMHINKVNDFSMGGGDFFC